jgi:hypothetical protein
MVGASEREGTVPETSTLAGLSEALQTRGAILLRRFPGWIVRPNSARGQFLMNLMEVYANHNIRLIDARHDGPPGQSLADDAILLQTIRAGAMDGAVLVDFRDHSMTMSNVTASLRSSSSTC